MKQKIKTKSRVSIAVGVAVGLIGLSVVSLAAAFVLNGGIILSTTYVVDVTDLTSGGADPMPDNSCKSEQAGGGICSLREVIEKVNASGNLVGRIDIILPSATMSLSFLDTIVNFDNPELPAISTTIYGGDMDIATTKPIYIYGKCNQGSSLSVIDASNLGERIFEMFPGTNVNISCVKFIGGSDDYGGAIRDTGGTLNVVNGYFQNNIASDSGGAIYVSDLSIVSISDSLFQRNDAEHGGAVRLNDNQSAQILNSVFRHNSARYGGALLDNSNLLSISGSSFYENESEDFGGALESYGPSVQILDSDFTNNSSAGGGAVTLENNLATIDNSNFISNEASRIGGGIFFSAFSSSGSPGTLIINNSEISENSGCGGGGLYVDGNLELSDSVVEGNNSLHSNCLNSGEGDWGGGMELMGTSTINNSSIVSNNTTGEGGGISVYSGSLSVTNSNISSNQAEEESGGVYVQEGSVSLVNSTLDGNETIGGSYSAVGREAGYNSTINIANCTISNNVGRTAVADYANIKGTILYNNSDGLGSTHNCNPTVVSGGYNLDGDLDGIATCNFSNIGDLTGVDPLFATGVLADNGGDTQTVALSVNSPAKDAIPAASCTDFAGNLITTDQRGILRANLRTTGTNCDMGAYEYKN